MEIELGDIVSFGWDDGYDSGTVCQVHTDNTVDVFRPFTHTADMITSGRDVGSLSVGCYVGVEVVKNINPNRITVVRKSKKLL